MPDLNAPLILISFLRTKLLRTIVAAMVAFQLLNISVDPIDHLTGAHDVAINEIESCIEFVLEVALGKADAIQESDEADTTSSRHHSTIILFCVSQNFPAEKEIVALTRHAPFDHYQVNFNCPLLTILSPPPRNC